MNLVVEKSESICGRVRAVRRGVSVVAFAVDSDGRDSPAGALSNLSCSSSGDRIKRLEGFSLLRFSNRLHWQ